MIKVKARIKLYQIRKTPFTSGYRPLFNFTAETKTSGQITLLDRESFSPGDQGVVLIKFSSKKFLGKNFSTGIRFTFDEGMIPIGKGVIEEIVMDSSE